MGLGIQVVVICEDLQHEVFIRALLYRRGFGPHDVRYESSTHGDAKKFVRDRLPEEVNALRGYHGKSRMLIVMADADNLSVHDRLQTLDKALADLNITPIGQSDPVFYFAPKWEIETWLAYLGGQTVDENPSNYRKLSRESDAYPLVDSLGKMCDSQSLRPTPPPSLERACQTYRQMVAFIQSH